MKTHCVATFNALSPALVLCQQLQEAGINALINDESVLERFWFMSEPLAAIHVEVRQPDYLPARKLIHEWEKSRGVLKDAVRCPECGMRLHGRIASEAGQTEGPVQSGTQAG